MEYNTKLIMNDKSGVAMLLLTPNDYYEVFTKAVSDSSKYQHDLSNVQADPKYRGELTVKLQLNIKDTND